jgi:MFS family permease
MSDSGSKPSSSDEIELKKVEEATTVQPVAAAKPESKDEYEVDLEGNENPQNWTDFKKWYTVLTLAASALCVTCMSSAASFTIKAVVAEFHRSAEVAELSITLFVLGMGLGPLVTGPLSEVYGRNIIYRLSFIFLTILTFGVAFAPTMAVFLVFRLLTGLAGSSFLTVIGGSVSDMFDNRHIGTPMSCLVLSPFVGPVVGPMYAGFVNQNINWRWTYWILIIWSAAQTLQLFTIRETFAPVVKKWKAAKIRKSTGDANYWAPLDKRTETMSQAIVVSIYRPFQLVFYEQMALLLNLWTALIFGILYLTFEAFPIIFGEKHHFNVQMTGLSFIGIGIGMLIATAAQPLYFNGYMLKQAMKAKGMPPPEVRLYAGQIGGIIAPLGLYWMAFTTYPSVHWVVPIIASMFFGFGIFLIFTSVLTYLIIAYRPIAASAVASNSFMRSSFAAAFPLFSTQMYNRLGTVGATALLAGLMTLAVPLPFIFKRIGPRIRAKSRFAFKM